jgi:hypothetical protein
MSDDIVTADGGTPEGGEQSLSGEIGDILLEVQQQLRDITGDTWPPSVMLMYINPVILEIVKLKPEAYPVPRVLQLNAGTEQRLSALGTTLATTFIAAISILDIVCNMGTTGSTTGLSIIGLEKNAIDHLVPDWQTYDADPVVVHGIKDSRNPLVFYSFPPQPASNQGFVKFLLSEPPPDITEDNTDFPLDPSYKIAFKNGMIWKCLSEETNQQGASQKAIMYRQTFLQDLGLKSNVDAQNNAKGK